MRCFLCPPQVTVPEMTGSNQVVFTVNATDADSGANADITYSMDIAPVDGFYINRKTGETWSFKAKIVNLNFTYELLEPVALILCLGENA